jgi:uncharacterized protein
MNASLPFTFGQQNFIAHKNGVLYWPTQHTLILADLHIGKTAHFRKNGINVSSKIFDDDIIKFTESILFFNPKEVLIVGDLFHSYNNNEHAIFFNALQQFTNITFKLISGNHDRYASAANSSIQTIGELYQCQNIIFSHEPLPKTTNFVISGHLHPRVQL